MDVDGVFWPSTFRIWIRPEGWTAKSSIGTDSAQGNLVRALMRCLNSSFSRWVEIFVRADIQCDESSCAKVNGRFPPIQ